MFDRKSRYAVQLNRLLLIPIGAWPIDKDASFVQRSIKHLSIIASYLLFCFLFVPTALYTFIEQSDPVIKMKFIGPMSFHLMTISKYISLVGRTEEISACFMHVEQDWKKYSQKNKKIELEMMKKSAKFGRYLTSLCTVFMYGGGFFYHAIMPLSTSIILSKHARAERNSQLSAENASAVIGYFDNMILLPYPTYGPLWKLGFLSLYLVQFLSGFILYTITIATCSILIVFVNHVCGQLEIVILHLRNYAQENNGHKLAGCTTDVDHYRSYKLTDIVERHLRALNFASRVVNNLNFICFVDFVGCTMNICFLEYYFITEWGHRNAISTMTYCILLVSFTFNIFIFCYVGELLTEQSKKVGEVIYAINWYTLPGKKAVDLIMIMMISSCHPARITAGKLVNLSLGTFCNVIKTSATYLNLLRTMMLND